MAESDYLRNLNKWHLELSMLHDGIDHIFQEMEGPDWMLSSAHIFGARLSHLVETLPFPPQTSD